MKRMKILVGWGILGFLAVFLATVVDSRPDQDANLLNLTVGRNVNMISGQKLPYGDPFLQRQNEPSLAVSTRNPLHILAGANDYRTVNISDEKESETLPNPASRDEIAAEGDAWLGLYKSFDGGQSWLSMLHPGYPQDQTTVGERQQLIKGRQIFPLKDFRAAADPVVRAGANGMFYYAGIAFNRPAGGTPPGKEKGCVFVSRLIDDNNKEKGDTIRFLDTTVIEDGTRGRFIDKPCLAVGLPNSGDPVIIKGPGEGNEQKIPPHSVYLAFSVFVGNNPLNIKIKTQIWLYTSKSCGEGQWKKTKVSEGKSINQGVSIAVDPRNSDHVYVAWRRFSGHRESNAILVCRSTDGGEHFSDPVVIASFAPFDQGSTPKTFRTNSYPSLTADDQGIVYAAWSARETFFWLFSAGRALIRMATCDTSSMGEDDVMTWSKPKPMDRSGKGHQFMPSLTFAAGRLVAVWYDQRNDRSGRFTKWIEGIDHTIDVRAAEAVPGAAPSFKPSIQISRYLFDLGRSVPESVTRQLHYNHPNYPLFKKGTQPFIGDYIDIAPAPMFLPNIDGRWIYNSDASRMALFHAAWADNRDVKEPQNQNWADYTPPSSIQETGFEPEGPAQEGQTRIRDQNVYTASLTGGLIAGSPGNAKPLCQDFWKTFVIFVKNMSGETRSLRLTIVIPQNLQDAGVRATFLQSDPNRKILDVTIPARSGISRTVFVKGPDGNKASFRVRVEEIDAPYGNPVAQGLQSEVILNPDIENPDIENPDIENPVVQNPDIENSEVHNPDIENPDIENPDIENPEVLNPDIENPDIENPEIINPDIENPDIENPDIENRDVVNPDIENPDIENLFFFATGGIRDKTWNVRNNGNTSSSYTFKLIKGENPFIPSPEIKYQLLIYRIHTSPVAVRTELKKRHHDELLASILNPVIYNPDIENPDIENPDIENPDIENPDIENATFFLAPGEEAKISLRGYKQGGGYWIPFPPEGIEGVVISHAVNSESENAARPVPAVGSNYDVPRIINKKVRLPHGNIGSYYEQAIVAIGGTTPYTWTWSGDTPPGLSINSHTGIISGIPSARQFYFFNMKVTDKNNNTASKMFFLRIT